MYFQKPNYVANKQSIMYTNIGYKLSRKVFKVNIGLLSC